VTEACPELFATSQKAMLVVISPRILMDSRVGTLSSSPEKVIDIPM